MYLLVAKLTQVLADCVELSLSAHGSVIAPSTNSYYVLILQPPHLQPDISCQ